MCAPWLPIISLASLALVLFVCVAIAAFPGFRDFFLRIKGTGKFSIGDYVSVEGVSVILLLAMIFFGGVVYPLSSMKTFADADKLTSLERDVERKDAALAQAQDEIEKLSQYKEWKIRGSVALPQDLDIDIGNEQDARAFFEKGDWEIFQNSGPIIVPRVDWKANRFELALPLQLKKSPNSDIVQINYTQTEKGLCASFFFVGEINSEWQPLGDVLRFAQVTLQNCLLPLPA